MVPARIRRHDGRGRQTRLYAYVAILRPCAWGPQPRAHRKANCLRACQVRSLTRTRRAHAAATRRVRSWCSGHGSGDGHRAAMFKAARGAGLHVFGTRDGDPCWARRQTSGHEPGRRADRLASISNASGARETAPGHESSSRRHPPDCRVPPRGGRLRPTIHAPLSIATRRARGPRTGPPSATLLVEADSAAIAAAARLRRGFRKAWFGRERVCTRPKISPRAVYSTRDADLPRHFRIPSRRRDLDVRELHRTLDLGAVRVPGSAARGPVLFRRRRLGGAHGWLKRRCGHQAAAHDRRPASQPR